MTDEPPFISVRIELPLTQEQATAIVIAAHCLGVEPWELAAHALEWRRSVR